IPAPPAASRSGQRKQKADASESADGVTSSFGALVTYAPGPLDALQRGAMTAGDSCDRLDDDDYPAYTMGRAAEMLGTTQGFLRAIGEAGLITPLRSEGGHRRYSRYQLRIAARARELVDHGTPVEAACRIVILEDQLEEAQRINAEHRAAAESPNSPTAP